MGSSCFNSSFDCWILGKGMGGKKGFKVNKKRGPGNGVTKSPYKLFYWTKILMSRGPWSNKCPRKVLLKSCYITKARIVAIYNKIDKINN